MSGRDFDDTASEASSAVSGMSAYAGSTAAGSTTTASSRRATSTVGGKKPSKRKNKKVRHEVKPRDRCNFSLATLPYWSCSA